jgi:DNA-binding transcriptional regulator GbsR (MarR family)
VEAANSRRSPRNDNTERPTPKTKEKKKFEVGDDRAFFEKPGDVFNKFAEFIEERMVEAFNEHIAPTINGQSAVREFWRDFYQENPEFNDKRWKRLIESTFSENMDKLGDLTPDRARDRLARILKRDFQEMGIQLKKGRAAAEEDDDQEEEELLEHRTSVEGGQARRSRASGQEEQEERPQTLTDLMRARKNARLMIRQEERA